MSQHAFLFKELVSEVENHWSEAEFLTAIRAPGTNKYFEVIKGACKAYFDIDGKFEASVEQMNQWTVQIYNFLSEEFGEGYVAMCVGRAQAQGVSQDKFSLHVVINDGWYYSFGTQVKRRYQSKVDQFVKSLDPRIDCDVAVYKDTRRSGEPAEQKFKAVGCVKPLDKDPAQRLKSAIEVVDGVICDVVITAENLGQYLVTDIRGCDLMEDLPDERELRRVAREQKHVDRIGQDIQNDGLVFTVDEVREILAGLSSERATRRESWRTVLWAVQDYFEAHGYSSEQGVDLCAEFSGRTTAGNQADRFEIEQLMQQSSGAGVTIASVMKMLEQDNVALFKDIYKRAGHRAKDQRRAVAQEEKKAAVEEKKKTIDDLKIKAPYKFSHSAPLVYRNFDEKFNNTCFESEAEMVRIVSEYYPRVLAKISGGKSGYYFVKKMSGGAIDMADRLGFSMYYMEDNKKMTITIEKFMERYGYLFDRADVEIDERAEQDPGLFNLFPGYAARQIDLAQASPAALEGLNRMQQFIREVMANNNESHYKYIISWAAGLVRASKINEVALTFYSPQGCGKNTFTDFLRLMLGDHTYAEHTGIDELVDKNNLSSQGKRLVVVNELASTKEEFRSNFDKIKPYITNTHLMFQDKFKPKVRMQNISNFVLTTNHKDALFVEQSNRRYAMFSVSTAHLQDRAYFTELRRHCFTPECASAFYTWLMTMPAADLVDVGVLPKTELQDEAKLLSLPAPLRFLKWVKDERGFDVRNAETNEIVTQTERVTSEEIFAKFNEWCHTENERATYSQTKFGMIISEYIEKYRTRTSRGYILGTIKDIL